jgi:HAD superfamily hydrolase (TIGR01509 family)
VLEAALFDWGGTLSWFEWDDALLVAGHRAGLAALGREDEADAFTARFAREKLPVLLAAGAAGSVDYPDELRDLLGPVSDEDLARFQDAEHAAWRPARSLVSSAHALLGSLHDRGLRLAVVANTWPDPPRLLRRELEELGVTPRVDAVVLSGEVGARKPEPAIFDAERGERGVAAEDAVFVGDRLVDDVAGAAAVGMTTVQALWFRVDDGPGPAEPDYLAFIAADVLAVVHGRD